MYFFNRKLLGYKIWPIDTLMDNIFGKKSMETIGSAWFDYKT